MIKTPPKMYKKILRRKKLKIEKRLKRKQWEDQNQPMFSASNIHYELSDKVQAVNCGGLGVIHQMVLKSGLIKDINSKVKLLKSHLPYHESDHVLNIAYNVLCGNVRLEDIELNRQDAGYLEAIGAKIIPDPTTAGDFTRRFKKEDIFKLMGCINTARTRIWEKRKRGFMDE
ncbi:MAG: hypothetical protein GY797_16145 [Deltaproteobacteria bacterium]|nr:hypothetical protein [Deltaproteobacteria bacterium]